MYRPRTHLGDHLVPEDEVAERRERERQDRISQFSTGADHIARSQGASSLPPASHAQHPDLDTQLSALAEQFAAMNQRG